MRLKHTTHAPLGPSCVSIYALLDPDSGAVHYIGCSARPLARLGAHLSAARVNPHSKSAKDVWLRSLLARGRHPELLILERTDLAHADRAEKAAIARYARLGAPLTNVTHNHRVPVAPGQSAQTETLTIGQAADMMDCSRSTIERAILNHELSAQGGRDAKGHRVKFVFRRELELWRLRTPREEGSGATTVVQVQAGTMPARHDTLPANLGELLRGVQAQGIAEVGRQVQPLVDRLVYAEARAARAEAERDAAILERNVERTRRYELEEQRRGLLRRVWAALRGA